MGNTGSQMDGTAGFRYKGGLGFIICQYCNKEMEQGHFLASSTGDMPVAFLEFYPETEFDKKGLIAALKRKGVGIKDSKVGYHKAHYCGGCNLVFGEFPAKPKKK